MIKHLETTTFILLWCLLLSVFLSTAIFAWCARHAHSVFDERRQSRVPIIPALILAPLLLTGAFKIFAVNLLYPVHLLASPASLIASSWVPAFVLMVSSGLMGGLWTAVRREFAFWRGKPFARLSLALGKNLSRELRRIVLAKSLLSAWTVALPWLFGELIVVEAVFNAPGLGLEAWTYAKIRDWSNLTESLASLILLYGLSAGLTSQLSQWLGRRLEGYV